MSAKRLVIIAFGLLAVSCAPLEKSANEVVYGTYQAEKGYGDPSTNGSSLSLSKEMIFTLNYCSSEEKGEIKGRYAISEPISDQYFENQYVLGEGGTAYIIRFCPDESVDLPAPFYSFFNSDLKSPSPEPGQCYGKEFVYIKEPKRAMVFFLLGPSLTNKDTGESYSAGVGMPRFIVSL